MISSSQTFQQTEKQEKPFYIIRKILDWYIRVKVKNNNRSNEEGIMTKTNDRKL
ncbi:hypothetical protein HDF25_005106 [Pedobacter cryoconitis]|uniref:Uncharacterized protein n=1 Tax=Pedobacter cryoconitis TaxID=188932 RepID=A0A7X0MLB7_9SPHI|nr:hypothetical protein [Pedobacter cryoconitis]